MLILDLLSRDAYPLAKNKLIPPWDLKDLGYVFSGRSIPIGLDKNTKHTIMEVVEEDTKKVVSFCFLLNKTTQRGVVLAHSFEDYLRCTG
jgi:hypothetical protein